MPQIARPASYVGKFVRSRDSAPLPQPAGESLDGVGALQAQVAKMIDAFRESEGREPTAEDRGFCRAYAELLRRFAGEPSGDG